MLTFLLYLILAPHSGQNFAVTGIWLPHLEHFVIPVVGGAIFVPHSGQNLDVAGIRALHLGQIISGAAGAWVGPVGVII
jgi:hypothetical protein